MKKLRFLSLVMVFLLSLSVVVMADQPTVAKPTDPNHMFTVQPVFVDAEGNVIDSFDSVKVGDTVSLITWTAVRANNMEDNWVVKFGELETLLDNNYSRVEIGEVEYWKSVTSFTTNTAGTYRFTYSIEMWNKENLWGGNVAKEITFVVPTEVEKEDKGYPGPSDNARIKSDGKAGGKGKYGGKEPGWYNE